MVSLGEIPKKKDLIVAIVCTEEGRLHALRVAGIFRNSGMRTEMDIMERGLGAQLAHASKTADFALVIGQREASSGTVTLKNLQNGEQKTLDPQSAVAEVASYGAR
jgi:histidyl-tRNA synthetase